MTSAEPIEIQVHAAYSADSLRTDVEIVDRFKITKKLYESSCPGIHLNLSELVKVEDKDLQDLDGSRSVDGVSAMKRLLTFFKHNSRPTIFYVRKGKWPFVQAGVLSSDFQIISGRPTFWVA